MTSARTRAEWNGKRRSLFKNSTVFDGRNRKDSITEENKLSESLCTKKIITILLAIVAMAGQAQTSKIVALFQRIHFVKKE